MSDARLSLGVDVGGTNIKVGVVDEMGRIRAQAKTPTLPERGVDAVVDSIRKAVDQVLQQSGAGIAKLRSIGVGVPGTADSGAGMVVYAPNIFWREVPLGGMLHEAFGLPVHLAQDTRAATWAESLVGSARGVKSVAGVTLGTGVGCGMVFDGRIFHGAMNTAGEFGHQIVEFGGARCNCGQQGCLEAHAGGLALVREAAERFPELLPAGQAVTVDDVYHLSAAGHTAPRALTDSVVRYVGIGLVNLINLNSVEMVCLSGGISNAPEHLLLEPLVAFVKKNVYQPVAERIRICRSGLGEDAPMIGASLLYRAFEQSACS